MMDHLSPGVDALVELEHKTIVDKYGEGYHSDHEGYAVILEEIQEAEEQLEYAKRSLDQAWETVRSDAPSAVLQGHVMRIEHYAKQLAAEAVQVAAVCRRMRGGFGNENA